MGDVPEAASDADSAPLAGSLTRGPHLAAVLEHGRAAGYGAAHLVPCGGVPLVLVAGERRPSAAAASPPPTARSLPLPLTEAPSAT